MPPDMFIDNELHNQSVFTRPYIYTLISIRRCASRVVTQAYTFHFSWDWRTLHVVSVFSFISLILYFMLPYSRLYEFNNKY